jgi:diguanylate cyclase (GGDEF)-like protein/PAS domain S-box-containing protein
MPINHFVEWVDRRRAGGSAGILSGRWVLSLAVAVAVAAALAVAGFHQQADARRRDQLELAEIGQLAKQLQLEADAVEHHGHGSAAAGVERLLGLALERLRKADPHGDAAANVAEAGATYLESATEYFRLSQAGRSQDAEEQAEESYDILAEAVYQASGFYNAQATRWLRRANLGSTLAIAVQALLIGFLFLSAERSRRFNELRLAEERARKEAQFRSLVQNSSDVTVVLGPGGEIRYLSPAVERVLGYGPEERLGKSGFANVHPDDFDKAQESFTRLLTEPEASSLTELRLRHADGSWRWVEINGANLLADSNVGGVVLNFRDISQRKELEDQLRHQALHDPLTGLANRALFNNLLSHTLSAAVRRNRQITAFYIDLDNFKYINDTLGHEAGDQLLLQVAQRLRASVRSEDTPARLGGDEFAILAEGLTRKGAADLAIRLLADLAPPFQLAGQSITVGASVGIAMAAHGESSEDLLRNADVAMYVAKTSGKGRFAVFEKAMYRRVKRHLEMELELRYALEHNQFELFYQPILALETGQLTGVEALLRWPDRKHNRMVLPGEFLPVAEQTGITVPLGKWVLENACRQVSEWQARYPGTAPVALSINFSERQFLAPDLLVTVEDALRASGLPGSHLLIEVGEDLLLNHAEVAREKLDALKGLGVRVAIDNFGGGFSSLRKLRQLPVDVVKIHKSFVDSVTLSPGDSELTHSLIDLAKRLHLQTIAEGIELDRQASALGSMGCELGQGYHLVRPLDAAGFESLLDSLGRGDWRGAAAGAVVAVERKSHR